MLKQRQEMIARFIVCWIAVFIASSALAEASDKRSEPAPGERKEMRFIGEDGEACTIAFRWCPSGTMKDNDPGKSEGFPNTWREGFWISETEISQSAYRCIVGAKKWKSVLEAIVKPARDKCPDEIFGKPDEELSPQQQISKSRRAELERKFSVDELPVIGIMPGEADDFCVKLSLSYDRWQQRGGRDNGFASYRFRVPWQYEWQYACRASDGHKHFVKWPEQPQSVPIKRAGGAKNAKASAANYEALFKEGEHGEKARQILDSFDGTEDAMERFLTRVDFDDTYANLSPLFLAVLHAFVSPSEKLLPVEEVQKNTWHIKGMFCNASEWVFVSESPGEYDDASPGDYERGVRPLRARAAGPESGDENANTWKKLSIWHWQDNYGLDKKDGLKKSLRVNCTGIRVVMTDAVSDAWFADVRELAERAFEGDESAQSLENAYENGVDVSSRDKEGRALVQARIGIYGALARARSGDESAAAKLLKASVAELKASGDEFFAQLESVVDGTDLRN